MQHASLAVSREATMRDWWVALWRPTTAEGSYEMTEIDGAIPRELSGTLYRNGPSQQVLPAAGYTALHLFDGDGLVQAIRFEDGRAHYVNRFVRHETFEVERAAGRYAFTGVNLPAEVAGNEERLRCQPNTNVLFHGGRLLALVENAPPFEIDRRTLAPIGTFDLEGKMLGLSTTAHPKIDGRSGEMVIHGYQPIEPFLQLYTIDPQGHVTLAENVEAPFGSMMHDVAITEHHVIFPLAPVRMDFDVLAQGRPFADCLRYEPERGMRFGVRRREPASPVRWFEATTPGFMFHFGNAYEQGDRIVFDACFYPDGAALLAGLRSLRSGDQGLGARAFPFLYEIDLGAGTCRERQLDDRGAEFPRLDDRLVGYRNRWGYAAVGREPAETVYDTYFNVIVKYDRHGGPSVYHDFGPGTWTGEPVFVPRTRDAAEDDGFVLALGYDGPSDRSFLAILDARNVDRAPLAKLWLRDRMPMGFHGNFAAGLL
jgi:carotenoid cleavage dioxygenase